MTAEQLFLYDSTLRDGSQAEEIAFSLEDKLRITEKLDNLGIHYIEAGWPGSNPRDKAYYKEVRKLKLKSIRVAAFGSTHHPSKTAAKDKNLKLLLESGAPVVTIVGKTWGIHVKDVLHVSKPQNIKLIFNSLRYLKPKLDEVIFDAEHFFDGYKDDSDYAMECLLAAQDAGADWIVLCDTNGGSLPNEIFTIVSDVKHAISCKIGIHCHNDSDLATANSIMAVIAGARQLHGTINGVGERCGNADLCAVIPNLQLKMDGRFRCLPAAKLKKLRETSLFVSEMANIRPRLHQSYVGQSAFAHKGGLHVDAVLKNPRTYEHIEPDKVGNSRRILISDLSGKGSILAKAKEFGVDLNSKDPKVRELVNRVKELESQGLQFEAAEGSLEILMRKAKGQWKKRFDVIRARVIVSISTDSQPQFSEAVIMIRTPDGGIHHAVAEGNGPVNALDGALRSALTKYYPELKGIQLRDFKVRILDEAAGTYAKTRVLIESGDETGTWGTVGVSENIIEASWQALIDSIDYRLHKKIKGKK
jgi:2-isopropylmalate synthase